MALTRREASIVMGMLRRGDHNQDIAAWFGENPARVVEVDNGTMYGVVEPAPPEELPPKGAVGPKARRLRAYAINALKALEEQGADGVETAIKALQEGLQKFDRNET